MKLAKLFAIILPVLATACAGSDVEEYVPGNKPKPPIEEEIPISYSERAVELFNTINSLYKVTSGPTAGMYNENYPKASGDLSASYLWPYDGLMSGMATLYSLGHTNIGYAEAIDGFEKYWRNSGKVNVGGYGSQTNGTSGGGTRFYDDNSIVGIDLVEAYKLTGEQRFLDRAGRIVDFLKSGEDNVHGGALWWNEDEKNIPGNGNSNKPTCANGYATLFLLEYYSVCPAAEKADVLAFAKRLYNWLVSNLRDPEDYVYWNDKNASGLINKTKWTYNTGVMISNGIRLYKITSQQQYLDDAIASATGSYSYYVRPGGGLPLAYPNHDPWFTIKLVKAYIEIEPYYSTATNYIERFITFLNHAYDNARYDNGLFYEDWTGKSEGRGNSLLMQDAALESLGLIALYKGENETDE